jgi:hypothetical protein
MVRPEVNSLLNHLADATNAWEKHCGDETITYTCNGGYVDIEIEYVDDNMDKITGCTIAVYAEVRKLGRIRTPKSFRLVWEELNQLRIALKTREDELQNIANQKQKEEEIWARTRLKELGFR